MNDGAGRDHRRGDPLQKYPAPGCSVVWSVEFALGNSDSKHSERRISDQRFGYEAGVGRAVLHGGDRVLGGADRAAIRAGRVGGRSRALLILPENSVPSTADITVTVRSADPLTQAGAISHLRQTPGLELEESPHRPGRSRVAVVLTHRLDDMTIVELRRLTREPGQRVVLVADRLREPELMAVLECGVRTIMWRSDATPSRLAQAVRAAAHGESHLPQDLLGRLMTHLGRSRRAAANALAPAVPAAGLAPREIEVLKLLADGMDTREIAAKLSYSERTIKNTISGLMNRLQLRHRAHAVAYAVREGYI